MTPARALLRRLAHSIHRRIGRRRLAVLDRLVERLAQNDCGVPRAPQMGNSLDHIVGLCGSPLDKQHSGECHINNVNATSSKNAIEPNQRSGVDIYNDGILVGNTGSLDAFKLGGLIFHEGYSQGCFDADGRYRQWTVKDGAFVEVSQAELSARKVASLRRQLAEAEAEAASLEAA